MVNHSAGTAPLMGRRLVSLKIIKEALTKEERIIMTKKLNRIINITTVLMALLLLGIAAGPASAAYLGNILAGSNISGGTNVTINGTTSPFGTDNYNQTYVNKVEALNFTIALDSTNTNVNGTAATGQWNLTNVSIDFTGSGITLLPTTADNGIPDLALKGTLVPNIFDVISGFNISDMVNVSVTSTSVNFTLNKTMVGLGYAINSGAGSTNNSLLWVNVSRALMPSTAGNATITIYAFNRTATVGTNVTTVTLQVLADSTAPTVTNLTMNGLSASGQVINNTVGGFPYQTGRNISQLNFTFDINETTAGLTSGINGSTIQVWYDYGLSGARLLVNTNTSLTGIASSAPNNTALILNRTTGTKRNVTISDEGLINTNLGFNNITAASGAGQSHTLTVIARDNSTNEVNTTIQTFFMPRVILGATRTSGISANGSDPVTVYVNFLAANGSVDTGLSGTATWLGSGVSFSGTSNTPVNSVTGTTQNTINFSVAGTQTIQVNSPSGAINTITFTVVAVAVNAAAGINGVTSTTTGSIVANGTDNLNVSVQAIDSGGNPVLKLGRSVTISEVNNQAFTLASGTPASQTTDSNGMVNFTVVANTTLATLTFQPIITLENGTSVNTNNRVTVNFVTGPARFMVVNTSVNVSSNAGTGYVGLGQSAQPANVSVDTLAAGNSTIISVFVTDDGNHTIASSTINFALSGNGSLSATSATTNSTGFASVTFTSGTTAANLSSIINVSSAANANASLYKLVRVNTTNGTANKIVLTANRTGLATGTSALLNASIQDASSNIVGNGNVNISFSIISVATLGNLSSSYVNTGLNGSAEVNFTAGSTTGTVIVRANATNLLLPGSPGNITNITLTIGTPDGMTLSLNKTNMPTTANATNGAPIVATAQLTSGGSSLGASGVNITFLVTSGSIFDPNNGSVGTNNGTTITVRTNSTGTAQAQINGSGTVGTATLTANDVDNPAISTQVAAITFTGSATTFTLTNGTISSSAGVSSTIVTVQLKDSAGNNVGSANGVTFVNGSGGTLSASSGTTNASTGQLNVTLSANTTSGAASPTVQAFISGMSPTSVTLTVNMPASGVAHGSSTVGVYRSGTFYLRNSNTAGNADVNFGYGLSSDTPVVGNWNGGLVVTAGVYRSGTFYLRNSNTAGNADQTIAYGQSGDTPVAGDWNSSGSANVGVYRSGTFYLRNINNAGFVYGQSGDIPVVGDWDGSGNFTVGVYRSGTFYLRNSNTAGNADQTIAYGQSGDTPVVGDWNADGTTEVGVYRNGVFYLRNVNDAGFVYGQSGDTPVVGDWNGQ